MTKSNTRGEFLSRLLASPNTEILLASKRVDGKDERTAAQRLLSAHLSNAKRLARSREVDGTIFTKTAWVTPDTVAAFGTFVTPFDPAHSQVDRMLERVRSGDKRGYGRQVTVTSKTLRAGDSAGVKARVRRELNVLAGLLERRHALLFPGETLQVWANRSASGSRDQLFAFVRKDTRA